VHIIFLLFDSCLFKNQLFKIIVQYLKEEEPMIKNMGTIDRTIRSISGLILGIIGALTLGTLGWVAFILIALGIILIATAVIAFCPLYLPFGIKTIDTKQS
jgi:hypothetical protein